jgi:hypothetical protein
MQQETVYLLEITFFILVLPVTLNAVVLWRLIRTPSERKTVGFLGLAANFLAMGIMSEPFFYNYWLFHSGAQDIPASAVAGSNLNLTIGTSFVLALSSIILGALAPKPTGFLIVLTGFYVIVLWVLVSGSVGVL